VAEATREIDLGLQSLKPGSKGTELGASIEEIKEGWEENGSQRMELKLRLKPDDLKSAFLVVDGTRTEIKRHGYSSFGEFATFTFDHKAAFPKAGTIVVEIYDQPQTFDTPFKIENITLLGKPVSGE
jgi:hypothetical protein